MSVRKYESIVYYGGGRQNKSTRCNTMLWYWSNHGTSPSITRSTENLFYIIDSILYENNYEMHWCIIHSTTFQFTFS
jgi:hypothetical protein